jgi:hypothetical protein
MHLGYQPMTEMVALEILTFGVERGVFRRVEPASTAGLLMTLYLGLGSTVDEQGHPRLSAEQVADFVLHALRAVPGKN